MRNGLIGLFASLAAAWLMTGCNPVEGGMDGQKGTLVGVALCPQVLTTAILG